MEDGLDYLFRPVLAGKIKGESLLDTSIDLAFIALMHEAMDIEIENTHRYSKAEANKLRK